MLSWQASNIGATYFGLLDKLTAVCTVDSTATAPDSSTNSTEIEVI